MELWCFFDVSLNKLSNKQTQFRWFQTSRWSCDVTMMLQICFYHADATVTLAGRVAHPHQWRHQWRVSKGWTTILENVMKLLADDCLGKIVGRYTPFELISLGAKITIMVETIFQLHNCLFSLVEISMDNVELNPDENVALCWVCSAMWNEIADTWLRGHYVTLKNEKRILTIICHWAEPSLCLSMYHDQWSWIERRCHCHCIWHMYGIGT